MATQRSTNGDSPQEVMTEREITKALGGQEIAVKNAAAYTDDEARSIKSWSQIADLMGEKNYETALADDILGDGFAVLTTDQKMRLIGKPMHILDWQFYDGDMGPFVSARVIVKDGDADSDIKRYRIADGSTGVYKQLVEATEKLGRTHSLTVRNGLRVSEYEVTIETKDGEERNIPARTFYLSV